MCLLRLALSSTSASIRYRRCQVRFRQPRGEEDLPEPAAAELRIQFDNRGVDQKQNEDPNLNSGKPVAR